jgi:hypothetical protein
MYLRVTCFTDRPEALLLFVPAGDRVSLPVLESPFVRAEVASALSKSGVDARVVESVAGRWTQAAQKARDAERAERHQRQHQNEATQAAILRNSANAAVRDRAEAVARKLEVDTRIRTLKDTIARARSDAASMGRYMDPQSFRKLERELSALKDDSQALQTRLGELRRQEAASNQARWVAELRAFRSAAHRILPADLFAAVESAAIDELDGVDDDDVDVVNEPEKQSDPPPVT